MMKLDIRQLTLLWQAAAARLQRSGLGPEDIDATIGSFHAPSIPDCLTTLMIPGAIDGCNLIDFQIRRGRRTDDIPGADDAPLMTGH